MSASQPQQCQYCLPDSAYCIWRKVAGHCLLALPPGSMMSPSNKSGKADRSAEMGVTTTYTSLVKPWARAVANRMLTAASHNVCHLAAGQAPLLHPYMSDREPPDRRNALPLISGCVEKNQDSAHLADPCPHTCPCSLGKETPREGWSDSWRDKRR